ncbi:hypothetical protein QBC45DRAFT_134181 [Copromyces sp. CBS 386.78]|nr:hypothetical protein QBC45DRAFT_134181 [Copromyces sp. CBS 386.78]
MMRLISFCPLSLCPFSVLSLSSSAARHTSFSVSSHHNVTFQNSSLPCDANSPLCVRKNKRYILLPCLLVSIVKKV